MKSFRTLFGMTLILCLSLFNTSKASDDSGFKFNTDTYLSWEAPIESEDGLQGGAFKVNRAYLTLQKSVMDNLSFRITVDAHQDDDGNMATRLKYVYALFKFDDWRFITNPNVEAGLVHTPWLDFEEHINYYRMQGTMFMERSGLFNSADFGVTLGGYFGGELDKEYKETVNSKYAGRYGSFAVGVYNGGGYHAKEMTGNKVVEGRVSVRPLPDILPGLQVSYFGILGSGNKEYDIINADSTTNTVTPDWQNNAFMLTYEHKYFTFAGQYVMGNGNQKGSYVDNLSEATAINGFSAFLEAKPTEHWRAIFRYDNFDGNTNVDNDENSRIIAGIGYDFGHHNVLILDYDKAMFAADGKDDIDKIKLTMQLHF